MTCKAQPKALGLFGRAHRWARLTPPFAVRPDRDEMRLNHDIRVGARCTECGEVDLRDLEGSYHLEVVSWRGRWYDGTAYSVTRSEALEITQQAADGSDVLRERRG